MNDLALKPNAPVLDASGVVAARSRETAVEQHSRASEVAGRLAAQVTPREVKAAVEQIDAMLKASRRELQFQVDEDSGEVIVRVRDAMTGEVIRQIPGEDVLRMAQALQDKSAVFVDVIA